MNLHTSIIYILITILGISLILINKRISGVQEVVGVQTETLGIINDNTNDMINIIENTCTKK